MNNIIYNTGLFSFILQIIIQIIDTIALFYISSKNLIYGQLLIIEYIVNIFEGTYYYWMLTSTITSKTNLTIKRYYDWFLSTPLMLFTFIIYLNETKHSSNLKFNEIVENEYIWIIIILGLNLLMLMFGYMVELNCLSALVGVSLGFIPFIIMFYLMYIHYVIGNTEWSILLFNYIVIIWALYGVAALMNYTIKNTMYNILDLFSKNFFALFLSYVVISG